MRISGAVLLSLLLLCGVAVADETPSEHVQLSLERFEALMHRANHGDGPRVTWGRGQIQVVLPGEQGSFATVTLRSEVRLVGGGDARVALLPSDVVLEQVTLDGTAATLTRRDGAHVALIPDGDDQLQVVLSYLAPIRFGASGHSALLPLPPMPGSTLRIETGGRDIGLWPEGRIVQEGDSLVATLPATLAVALRFDAHTRGHQVQRASYELRVDAPAEGVDVAVRLEVQAGAERTFVRLAPETTALVDVREEDRPLVTRVRDGWHEAILNGTGPHDLVARFKLAVDRSQGQPFIRMALDRAPITEVVTSIPGKRTVTMEPAIPVTSEQLGELEQAMTRVSGFLPPSSEVVIRWTESRPTPESLVRINTDTYQLVRLQEGVLRSRVHLRYDILRGKTRELAIQLPENVVLYRVEGEGIEDWRTFAATEEAPRQVQVTLGREREGALELTLDLEMVVGRAAGADLAVPIVQPLDAFRQTGVVALFDGDKVGFESITPTGYTPVGQDALPVDIRQALEGTVSQAFKHIGTPAALHSKVATVQPREVLYDARVVSLYSLKEGAILANATVQVEVKSGKSERLLLTFPEDVTILSVTAPSLSRKGVLQDTETEAGRQTYELRFSQALEGTIEAHFEFERLHPEQTGPVALPDIRVPGAEVQEGSFGITAETGIEVQQSNVTALRRVDVTDLPDSVRRRAVGESEILMGYQYAHAPWELSLDVKRHETVETLTAVVEQAWIESTVHEDGHLVTRFVMSVKNDDRQFLRVTLPAESKVWSVTADGVAIKAVSDDSGAVAIPLRKGRTSLIALTYEKREEPLGWFGGLTLSAPQTDVLVTNLQWLWRTPRDYAVYGVDTQLQEAHSGHYEPPPMNDEVAVSIPSGTRMKTHLFLLAVTDPSESPATIDMSYVTRPGDDAAIVLWGLAILFLVLSTYWRAQGRRRALLLLILGLALGGARLYLWTVEWSELLMAVIAVSVAAVAGAIKVRRGEGVQ